MICQLFIGRLSTLGWRKSLNRKAPAVRVIPSYKIVTLPFSLTEFLHMKPAVFSKRIIKILTNTNAYKAEAISANHRQKTGQRVLISAALIGCCRGE
jgi:hypothetical protein